MSNVPISFFLERRESYFVAKKCFYVPDPCREQSKRRLILEQWSLNQSNAHALRRVVMQNKLYLSGTEVFLHFFSRNKVFRRECDRRKETHIIGFFAAGDR